jgi:hypothetical protein
LRCGIIPKIGSTVVARKAVFTHRGRWWRFKIGHVNRLADGLGQGIAAGFQR